MSLEKKEYLNIEDILNDLNLGKLLFSDLDSVSPHSFKIFAHKFLTPEFELDENMILKLDGLMSNQTSIYLIDSLQKSVEWFKLTKNKIALALVSRYFSDEAELFEVLTKSYGAVFGQVQTNGNQINFDNSDIKEIIGELNLTVGLSAAIKSVCTLYVKINLNKELKIRLVLDGGSWL